MNARRNAVLVATAAAAAQEGPASLGARIASLPRMLRDGLTGRYPDLGRGRLAAMLLAAVYIVSPVDLLPEALLTIPGLADDAAVGAWLVAALLSATTAYRSWEGTRADLIRS